MRILVDNSGYHLQNLGDIAMLQTAVSRLKELWPDASIEVITYSKERLEKFCPGTIPVDADFLTHPIVSAFPVKISNAMAQLHKIILPQLLSFARIDGKKDQRNVKGAPSKSLSLSEALVGADLIVASGGGYINDTFYLHALGILNVLSYAIHLGKPAAMFGQGIGPLESKWLLRKARSVLPQLDLMTLREGRFGPPLLQSLGVQPSKITVTGDDALEIAYSVRAPQLGEAIGINLRMAYYAGVTPEIADRIKSVIQNDARQLNAQIIPIPISLYARDPDAAAIESLVSGYDQTISGEIMDTPVQIIQKIGRCRVIITGSYHAAVFALAQGIPAICLTNSSYYDFKFGGLMDLFGDSCQVVSMSDSSSNQKLSDAIYHAWENADLLYQKTLTIAGQQIKSNRDAYQQFFNVVNNKINA